MPYIYINSLLPVRRYTNKNNNTVDSYETQSRSISSSPSQQFLDTSAEEGRTDTNAYWETL